MFIRTRCGEWVEVGIDLGSCSDVQAGEMTDKPVDCMACIAIGGSS